MLIQRAIQPKVTKSLGRYPAVGLIGPRQIGKTTLAHEIGKTRPSIYLDLENPTDLAKISEPAQYFETQKDKLIILDEIHRAPELFRTLRGIIDARRRQSRRTGQFLILGSASLELLRQSSESLAGRIAFVELGPILPTEIGNEPQSLLDLWTRGGFPDSFLAPDDAASFEWRLQFIRTYLERDIPLFGPRIPAETLRRFWTMLAHSQGSVLNASRIATSLGVSGVTVARYLDLMVDLLLVRRLAPWISNTGKRLTRSPKIYVRDSGIVHALLGIRDTDELLGHPIAGPDWEGHVIETLLGSAPSGTQAFFYNSAGGAEIDLILEIKSGLVWAVEIKRSLAPKPTRGFFSACAEIKPKAKFVVYPGTEQFPLQDNVQAIPIVDLARKLEKGV
jgi:predicted AAA+ superfamily ATPase